MNSPIDKQDDDRSLVLLVNKAGNPHVAMDESSISDEWKFVEAPPGWTPASDIAPDGQIDAVLVFPTTYAEKEALAICKSIRECSKYDGIPLIVAISMYQMPLGNSAKKLPHTSMLFMPLKEGELKDKLKHMQEA
jgi:hypothetical protein